MLARLEIMYATQLWNWYVNKIMCVLWNVWKYKLTHDYFPFHTSNMQGNMCEALHMCAVVVGLYCSYANAKLQGTYIGPNLTKIGSYS